MKNKAGMIFVAFVVIVFLSGCSDNSVNHDEFAKCLTESGAIMYGTYWCSHCKAQKKEFGDSFGFINYVECTEEKSKCERNGVKGFPTWKINGKLYPGEQPLDKLSALTGCEL